MKIKGVIEDFKILKSLKKRMIIKIVKIYLGVSLVLLWAVWGQFICGQFLGPAYISQDLQAPSYVVGTNRVSNNRVLIYCTCHLQGGSLCFSFFCLLVSSVSDFCPDTRGWWWTLVLGSLVQSHCGEEGTPQTHNTGVYSQCLSHTGPAPARGTHSSGSRLLHQEPSEAGPGLHAPPRSKPLRSRYSGSPQRCRLSWA